MKTFKYLYFHNLYVLCAFVGNICCITTAYLYTTTDFFLFSLPPKCVKCNYISELGNVGRVTLFIQGRILGLAAIFGNIAFYLKLKLLFQLHSASQWR
jgi:hypothetical protein